MTGECALCPTKTEFSRGIGWNALPPFKGAKGSVCQSCVQLLTIAWAKEYKRRNIPPVNPTPTSPPAGAGTAYVEQLASVA